MKTSIKLLAFLTAFSFLASSCKKENTTTAMTEEEAAEVIALSVSANSNGLSVQTEEIAARTNTYGSICSYSKDSTIVKVNTAGTYTWNYTFNWHWDVACTGGLPGTMNTNYSMKGNYDAPRMSSNDSAKANLSITNLTAGTQYTYNGTYTRDGSQTSKIRNKNTFTSKLILNLSNVKVNKITRQIDSGTAAVTITGATTGGINFNYGGSVAFTGNKTATVTLNNGGVYTINW
jgi:hypothetical protein